MQTPTERSPIVNSEKAAHPGSCAAHFCFLPSGRERTNHMIPDEPFNFNHFGALTNFDDHDVRMLHRFPKALCPICSTIYLGGMFSVGEYPHHRGYHFLWESASPRRIRLLAMVCRSEGITLDLLVQMSPTTRTEPRCNMRAV